MTVMSYLALMFGGLLLVALGIWIGVEIMAGLAERDERAAELTSEAIEE